MNVLWLSLGMVSACNLCPGLRSTMHFANDAAVRVKSQEPLDCAIDTSLVRVELGHRRPTPRVAAR